MRNKYLITTVPQFLVGS